MSEGKQFKGVELDRESRTRQERLPSSKPRSRSAQEGVLDSIDLAPIAEITTSSITGFQAECLPPRGTGAASRAAGAPTVVGQQPDLPPKPRFGSFLRVESQESSIFAVVYNVITGPQDTIHKPSALGLTREELRLEQPHIFSLLKTEVHALLVGYGYDGEIFQHLPPHPPDVHDFVYAAKAAEIEELTRNFEFLRLLSYVSDIPSDELMAATIREAHRALGSNNAFLVEAGQALSTMLRADYDRLLTILKKIKPPK